MTHSAQQPCLPIDRAIAVATMLLSVEVVAKPFNRVLLNQLLREEFKRASPWFGILLARHSTLERRVAHAALG